MNHEIAKKLKNFTYFMKRDAKSVRKLWTILTTEWPIQGQKNKFIDNMTPPLKQEEASDIVQTFLQEEIPKA